MGIPLAIALGVGLVAWRRRSSRATQADAARKRRLDSHPFDTIEGQNRLTSPFASNAFSNVNAAAVAPVDRGSDETMPTLTSQRSGSSDTMGAIYSVRHSGGSVEAVRGSAGSSTVAATAAAPSGASGASHGRQAVGMQPLSAILRRTTSEYLSAPEANTQALRLQVSQVRRSLGTRPSAHESPPTMFPATSLELPFSDWEIRPESLQILQRPDGTQWELGKGGFGRVYKALRDGVQPVAVKVLQVSYYFFSSFFLSFYLPAASSP